MSTASTSTTAPPGIPGVSAQCATVAKLLRASVISQDQIHDFKNHCIGIAHDSLHGIFNSKIGTYWKLVDSASIACHLPTSSVFGWNEYKAVPGYLYVLQPIAERKDWLIGNLLMYNHVSGPVYGNSTHLPTSRLFLMFPDQAHPDVFFHSPLRADVHFDLKNWTYHPHKMDDVLLVISTTSLEKIKQVPTFFNPCPPHPDTTVLRFWDSLESQLHVDNWKELLDTYDGLYVHVDTDFGTPGKGPIQVNSQYASFTTLYGERKKDTKDTKDTKNP